jgi:hypothetical protein
MLLTKKRRTPAGLICLNFSPFVKRMFKARTKIMACKSLFTQRIKNHPEEYLVGYRELIGDITEKFVLPFTFLTHFA